MPHWEFRVDVSDVFHNPDMTFEQRRDGITATLRRSRWFKTRVGGDEFDDLALLVDDLAGAKTPDEFDDVWGAIYDEADHDRAWIATT